MASAKPNEKNTDRLRHLVLSARGDFCSERASPPTPDQPRKEFVEIARTLDAAMLSCDDGRKKYGWFFGALFNRIPLWGAAVVAVLARNSFDRIYVTGEDVGLRLALLMRWTGWRGRIVCVVHNIGTKGQKLLRMIGSDIFECLLTVSERQAGILLKECAIPAAKVQVVGNWVDDVFFRPSDAEPAEYIMACGAENRDYATAFQVAERTGWKIVIFGHGFFGAGKLSVAPPDSVEMMPKVSFEDLRDAYSAASLVLLPLNDVEYAAGVTGLVEAMAMGKTVVAARSRGIVEYLAADPGPTFLPGDAGSAITALESVLSDREMLRIGGERNRQWVVRHCSLDDYVEKVSSLMRRIAPSARHQKENLPTPTRPVPILERPSKIDRRDQSG